MSFLSPLFLWLLPLVSIPLIIHLLNRRRLITIDFSTLRFLKLMEKESIRKLQILQIILLILRTIIILLIIFMITRPVIKGFFDPSVSESSSIYSILLDDTFSMNGNDVILKKALIDVLKQIPGKSTLNIISINDGLIFQGLKEDAPSIDAYSSAGYGAGNIKNALLRLKEMEGTRFTSNEIYIISDGEYSSLTNISDEAKFLDKWNIFYLQTPTLNKNIAISNVKIVNEIILADQIIEIEAELHNSGSSDMENVLLQLIIDELSVGQQLVTLKQGDRKFFNFKTALPKTGIHKCFMEIERDDRGGDNRFYFSITIPKTRKIALFRKKAEDSYYLTSALNALNLKGETIAITEFNNIAQSSFQLLDSDVLIINDIKMLELISDSRLEGYLVNGGHIIVFPVAKYENGNFNILNEIFPDIRTLYSNISFTLLYNDSFLEIDTKAPMKTFLKEVFTNSEQERNIKYFQYLELPFHPEFSHLQLNGGATIWNRHELNRGIVDIFGFSPHLDWTNFPLKGAFLPFIHYLIFSNSFTKKDIYQHVGSDFSFRPPLYTEDNIYHLEPDGGKNIIRLDDNQALTISAFKLPGIHYIQTNSNIIAQRAINIPYEELVSHRMEGEKLSLLLPENSVIIPLESNLSEQIRQARIGVELWHYILYVTLILLIIEMLLSNAKRKK